MLEFDGEVEWEQDGTDLRIRWPDGVKESPAFAVRIEPRPRGGE